MHQRPCHSTAKEIIDRVDLSKSWLSIECVVGFFDMMLE